MSVDPSGHEVHITLEHCEARPSPYPPVFDAWLPNRTVIGNCPNTWPQEFREAIWRETYDAWRAREFAPKPRKEAA